jgi:hypothetical protein
MTVTLGSWIAQAIIQHDKVHGADLTPSWEGQRFCQLIQASHSQSSLIDTFSVIQYRQPPTSPPLSALSFPIRLIASK